MNTAAIQEWLKLTEQTRRNIFGETAAEIGLPAAAVEKDWWVVRTLEQVFGSSIAPHTVFKGGTSLSKAWGLIDRFSEDIDLALDRRFLGIEKPDSDMNGSQVSKLRKLSLKYVTQHFFPEMQTAFIKAGFSEINMQLEKIKNPDDDPITIIIEYPSVTDKIEYLPPRVKIEIGSRSLIEPFDERSITSMVGEKYKGMNFADVHILIPTVNPQSTLLVSKMGSIIIIALQAENIRMKEQKIKELMDEMKEYQKAGEYIKVAAKKREAKQKPNKR
jgi:hypothetical protein